jgi:hypothetical protein
VVEEKGIYSVENFLTSRRLMYWQVYLHKTSVSAERLLTNIIKRARYLATAGERIDCSAALKIFLEKSFTLEDLKSSPEIITSFGQLDDGDIWGAIKLWKSHRDQVLSELCSMIVERRLFKIKLSGEPIGKSQIENVRRKIVKSYPVLNKDASYLFSHGSVTNEAYTADGQHIMILMKSGEVIDLASASDLPQIKAMTKSVKKNFLCWPKNVDL